MRNVATMPNPCLARPIARLRLPLVAALLCACSAAENRTRAWARSPHWQGAATAPQDPASDAHHDGWFTRTLRTVVADHEAFYDTGTMLALGAGVGLAGLSANTQLDRDIYEDVLPEWRTEEWDEFRDNVVPFGDGAYVLPVLATTSLLAPALGGEIVGEWGERSLRAILVGAPPVLALQRLTGGGRPDDPANTTSSEWEPFDHSNGVSGHAFIGAVPFLTIAAMQENVWIDGVCYVGSTAVAAARLQGFRHYFSQVVLGWFLGYLAVDAVSDSGRSPDGRGTSIEPLVGEDGVAVFVVHRF